MKNSELIALLTANTNKTDYLRTYSKHWPSGARRLPDEKLYTIGRLVSLIHARLTEGKIHSSCVDGKDVLMLYNFQPFQEFNGEFYCTLDMLAKPISKVNETDVLDGAPLQLVVNLTSSEVISNSMGLLRLGFITTADIEEDDSVDIPVSYGFFNDFLPTTSYLPYGSKDPVDANIVFDGKANTTLLLQYVSVDAIPQARKILEEQGLPYQYVAELKGPKEKLQELFAKGIHKSVVKIIQLHDNVIISNMPAKEVAIEDEIKHLEDSMSEIPPDSDELWGS